MAKVKTLGQSIDELYRLDKEISEQNAKLKALNSTRFKLETLMLDDFGAKEIRGASGKLGKASIRKTEHATVKDRKKFFSYVLKNKAFDLLQNRVTSKAFFDRKSEGVIVPGIDIFVRHKISVLKRR